MVFSPCIQHYETGNQELETKENNGNVTYRFSLSSGDKPD